MHASTLGLATRLLDLLCRRGAPDEELEALHRFVLEGRRVAFGAAHPHTLAAVNDLVRFLHERAPADAVALCREALEACRTAGPASPGAEQQPAAMDCAFNLATMLHEAGELDEAEPLYERVLRDRTAAWGGNHEETRLVVKHLQLLLDDQKARLHAELAGQRATLGASHATTLDTAAKLVRLHIDRCRHLREAEELARDTLARATEALGAAHATTLRCMMHLGYVLEDLGDDDGAEPLLRTALAAHHAALGPAHRDTLEATNVLAWLLGRRAGCAAEAVALARDASRGFEASLGAAHAYTLNALDTLAAVLLADGQAYASAAVRLDIAGRSGGGAAHA